MHISEIEENKKRYFGLKREAEQESDFHVFLGKGKSSPLCARSGAVFPIESAKVILDKGDGKHIVESFLSDSGQTNDVKFSLVMEKHQKMVFVHDEHGLHSFGYDKNYTELQHVFIYVRMKYFVTMIFASADSKRVNVYERVIDEDDSTTAMINIIFDKIAENAESEGGDGYEFII